MSERVSGDARQWNCVLPTRWWCVGGWVGGLHTLVRVCMHQQAHLVCLFFGLLGLLNLLHRAFGARLEALNLGTAVGTEGAHTATLLAQLLQLWFETHVQR